MGTDAPAELGLRVLVPGFEVGEGVERAASLVPAGRAPHLEVEVTADRVAGFADDADRLAGADGVAGVKRRGFGQVRVHEVVGSAAAVDHEVVAGGRLEAGELDLAAAGGDQRQAAGRGHVLALVGVAGAGRAEAAGAEVEFVRAEDREGVAVEVEADDERARGARLARRRGRRLGAHPEDVLAVVSRPAFAGGAVPAQALRRVGGDVFAVEGPDHFPARAVDDVDADVVERLVAAQREPEGRVAVAEVEGPFRSRFGGEQGQRPGAGIGRGGPSAACRRRRAAAGRRRAAGRGGGDRGAGEQQRQGRQDRYRAGHRGPETALLSHSWPLSRSPAELADGLALKESRYGTVRPIRPRDLLASTVPPLPPGCPNGIRHLLARQYRPQARYYPPAASASPRGLFTMKTFVATAANRQRDWYVVDAEGKTLGRLATQLADALRGKRKPEYTPHVDTGDFIVVVNAEKIRVTGDKLAQKTYWRHSGYPGGIKSRALAEMLERRPEEVIRKAVKGMLPRNRLARQQLTKLKVYAGPDHPHQAQQPKPMETES